MWRDMALAIFDAFDAAEERAERLQKKINRAKKDLDRARAALYAASESAGLSPDDRRLIKRFAADAKVSLAALAADDAKRGDA